MDPTERFSARADVYARSRPSYPAALIELLRSEYGLTAASVVADLGSGTGIFTRLLLEAGATVYAVEPNAEMRAAAERDLGDVPGFRSISGRAEATGIDAASVDLVTAAQAFHWFEVEPTREEIARILKATGRAAFIWNDRDTSGTPFLARFEAILVEHCPGYRLLQGKSSTPSLFDAFFGAGCWTRHTMTNEQRLDRRGLVERVQSASYAPRAGSPEGEALARALEDAFDEHAEGGFVRVAYTTVVIGGSPRRT